MGTADAANERIISGCYRRIDITKFKEEPDQMGGVAPGAKLLIHEVASINVPKVESHEFAMMYMQQNPPDAMPGCTSMTNGDPSMGGQVIRNTAAFYEMCRRIEVSLECLPQDFGYDPDRADNKPPIYVSVMGIDLDDHEAFMFNNKRPGGKDEVKPKHLAVNVQLAEGQKRPEISENAYIYLQDRQIHELKFVLFADWKTQFMLYLNLALVNGESLDLQWEFAEVIEELRKGTRPSTLLSRNAAGVSQAFRWDESDGGGPECKDAGDDLQHLRVATIGWRGHDRLIRMRTPRSNLL